jgi:hypothetical protein
MKGKLAELEAHCLHAWGGDQTGSLFASLKTLCPPGGLEKTRWLNRVTLAKDVTGRLRRSLTRNGDSQKATRRYLETRVAAMSFPVKTPPKESFSQRGLDGR